MNFKKEIRIFKIRTILCRFCRTSTISAALPKVLCAGRHGPPCKRYSVDPLLDGCVVCPASGVNLRQNHIGLHQTAIAWEIATVSIANDGCMIAGAWSLQPAKASPSPVRLLSPPGR